MNFIFYLLILSPSQCSLRFSQPLSLLRFHCWGLNERFCETGLERSCRNKHRKKRIQTSLWNTSIIRLASKKYKKYKKGLNCPSLISCHLTLETNGQIEGKPLNLLEFKSTIGISCLKMDCQHCSLPSNGAGRYSPYFSQT